jgi:hypothetical protein
MRNTIILGTFIALLGLGAVAQASDQTGSNDNDAIQVTREASHDERGDRHHRYERSERSRDRHDSRERGRTSHDVTREGRERR